MQAEYLAEEVMTLCRLWNEAKATGNQDTEAALLLQLWEIHDIACEILEEKMNRERAALMAE